MLRRTDLMFCKAALIIFKLLEEGKGHYNAFHIRRGEFQYKVVKIPADQMLANVGEFIPKDTLVYVASDEKNMSFFKPFRDRFPAVRMLKDYMDLAGLHSVNPNYLGMIDQIICVKADLFVGTWFSTFSGDHLFLSPYHKYELENHFRSLVSFPLFTY